MDNKLSRRDFLKYSTYLAAIMGLESTAVPRVVEALELMASGNAPVIWLQGQSCSGCSVSLLNSEAPTVAEVITQYISLKFHSSLSAATGEVSMDVLKKSLEKKDYVLCVEGSVPASMPLACRVGGQLFTEQVVEAARNAKAVIAVGACAAYGGIPAAESNQTGSAAIPDFLIARKVTTPTIRVPGCPTHPDWLVGTIVHTLKFGLPELDKQARPTMFYANYLHDQCPRFADYEREFFAKTFGEPGCLFKLGCAGPITRADCSTRLWNGGTTFCINAGAPCIGCASSGFALKKDFSLYTKERAQTAETLGQRLDLETAKNK